jgi:dynein light chain roadblock-type
MKPCQFCAPCVGSGTLSPYLFTYLFILPLYVRHTKRLQDFHLQRETAVSPLYVFYRSLDIFYNVKQLSHIVQCRSKHLCFIELGPQLTRATQNASSHFSHTLERLSSKPGVVASLVIDRASNALLKSTGTFAFWSASTSNSTQTAGTNSSSAASTATETPSIDPTSQFASTIICYVDSTGALVHHMDSEVCRSRSEAESKLIQWKLG